ncbi:MAG TPA: exopolysaccharide biosynthesis GT4 family glycosyltransferase EpsE [Polyangiaceae bacterium]|nr:exopolysaccharide biosynthesis GT4 family glycosyltransferase EpsE [Polyangiaceae bacterium]
MRIGYLVPEFPSQTHTWIWREYRALAELGVEADLVSTRRPALVCHPWTKAAQALTRYLVPFERGDAIEALRGLLEASPSGLRRCLEVVRAATDVTPLERLKLLSLIVVAGRLSRLAKQRGWAQIHVMSAGQAAHLGAFASYLSGIDYSLTLLASMQGYGPNQPLKWRDAAFAVVMSEKLLAEVREVLGSAAPKRVAIGPMGVDLDEAQRTTPYVPWRPGEPCRIYGCGRLHPVKGHHILIAAASKLRRKGIDVRVQIAGAEVVVRGYRDRLLSLVEREGLTGAVDLLGAVPEDRHRQLLEQAHLFVLASLDEGISVAAMEAMALETPAVVTDVGGMRELVAHEEDALLVPPEDPDALAEAMLRVLEEPERALSLSRSSRRKIAAAFHHRRSAQALAECLRMARASREGAARIGEEPIPDGASRNRSVGTGA